MKAEFNITSEDKFVKTTINIRTGMMTAVHQRMRELYKEDFVDYLRDLIYLDLKIRILGAECPVRMDSLKKFRERITWPKKETEKEALERIKNTPPSVLRAKSRKSWTFGKISGFKIF